jgi:hypothetical protein
MAATVNCTLAYTSTPVTGRHAKVLCDVHAAVEHAEFEIIEVTE